MPPFHILDVNHTGITVRDLDRSLAFWEGTLGFELLYRARRTGTFAAEATGVPGAEIEVALLHAPGSQKIELLQYHAPEDRAHVAARPCDVGSLHVAFDVDDLDAALAHIAAQGWHAAGRPQVIAEGARRGTRLVYVRDPDGTTIELMQPPAP